MLFSGGLKFYLRLVTGLLVMMAAVMSCNLPGESSSGEEAQTPPGSAVVEPSETDELPLENTPASASADQPAAEASPGIPGQDEPAEQSQVESPDPMGRCAPLPPPSGNVVRLDPSRTAELGDIVAGAAAGDTILLADGTYDLQGISLWVTAADLTIRSESGNREAVILDGGYETGEIIAVAASGVTISDITLKRALYHPIHVIPGESSNTENTTIYNVVIIDPGQQAIKINANEARTLFVDNGLVACSRIELTPAGQQQVLDINGECYTGGVDGHQVAGWVVRDNHIEGFWCDRGLAEHGIHFWTGSRDTLIERNVLVNNARGIGLGLGESGEAREYTDNPCPETGYVGHFGGILRNNFISAYQDQLYASEYGFDCGICMDQACGTQVFHNTVASTEAPFSSIEWRFPNSSVEITNNMVTHNMQARDGGSASLSTNILGISLDIFVDPLAGDLHLHESASDAIDMGVPLGAGLCDDDIDGSMRPSGAAPDIGADEFDSGG